MLEQTRVNDEVWLPLHVTAKIDVRLASSKNFDVNVEQTYRDYKKFRATARIVGVGRSEGKVSEARFIESIPRAPHFPADWTV
jgi:hypothetical protein